MLLIANTMEPYAARIFRNCILERAKSNLWRIKNDNVNPSVRLPLCLTGWKDYKKIKKLTFFNNCSDCILKKLMPGLD